MNKNSKKLNQHNTKNNKNIKLKLIKEKSLLIKKIRRKIFRQKNWNRKILLGRKKKK